MWWLPSASTPIVWPLYELRPGMRDDGRVYSALVLAGGAGRRLGGRDKPSLAVGGAPMLSRVLDAVAGATSRIVVGPDDLVLPEGILRTSEDSPGGGPAAALAAGLPLVDTARVALLAADLPFLTPRAVGRLLDAFNESTVDGVVFVDGRGRRQTLCGVWRTAALRDRVARLRSGGLVGLPLRELLSGLVVHELRDETDEPPPWYDCDTQADLDRARGWAG